VGAKKSHERATLEATRERFLPWAVDIQRSGNFNESKGRKFPHTIERSAKNDGRGGGKKVWEVQLADKEAHRKSAVWMAGTGRGSKAAREGDP